MAVRFLTVASTVGIIVNCDYFELPLYDCSEAKTTYDLGYCIGNHTKSQIETRWNKWEMVQNLYQWTTQNTTGQQTFEQFYFHNNNAFPEYIQEAKGIAAASSFSIEQIFIMVCNTYKYNQVT